jgi:hypothetical protein
VPPRRIALYNYYWIIYCLHVSSCDADAYVIVLRYRRVLYLYDGGGQFRKNEERTTGGKVKNKITAA